MSGYKGLRGPNVSQYIANLNELSPPSDNLAEPAPVNDDFSAFLNTDFFDINGGTNVDLNSSIDFGVDFDIKPSAQPTAENTPRQSISAPSTKPAMEFNLNGKFASRQTRLSLLLSFHHPIFSVVVHHNGSKALHYALANHGCSLTTHPTAMCSQPRYSCTSATHSPREAAALSLSLTSPPSTPFPSASSDLAIHVLNAFSALSSLSVSPLHTISSFSRYNLGQHG